MRSHLPTCRLPAPARPPRRPAPLQAQRSPLEEVRGLYLPLLDDPDNKELLYRLGLLVVREHSAAANLAQAKVGAHQ